MLLYNTRIERLKDRFSNII